MNTSSLYRRALCFTLLAVSVNFPRGAEYSFSVVASGLARPVGIAAQGSGTIYFTQVPAPGAPDAGNSVNRLQLGSGRIITLHEGEPEPVNLALDARGNLYWTCQSAGVILAQARNGATIALLTGLNKPSGLAVSDDGVVYFTEVPAPGVPGGANAVRAFAGGALTTVSQGEPEPTDIVVSPQGVLYWTCKSAGVILTRRPGDAIHLLLAGLAKPSGIALDHQGKKLYWTEIPTPGVPGHAGGDNKIMELDLPSGITRLVHQGDPEPTDIAVARNGNLYWTCTSAGVIVEAKRPGGRR